MWCTSHVDPMATGLRYRVRRAARQIGDQHRHIGELHRACEEVLASGSLREGDLRGQCKREVRRKGVEVLAVADAVGVPRIELGIQGRVAAAGPLAVVPVKGIARVGGTHVIDGRHTEGLLNEPSTFT